MQCKKLAVILSVVFAGLLVTEVNAQSPHHSLQTLFTGAARCLDIVNDGANNQLTMAACDNVAGQFWQIEPSERPGYFRLRTLFTGAARCLDIVNDGANNQLTMAACGNVAGQFWVLSQAPS